jgi:hypothetical protein
MIRQSARKAAHYMQNHGSPSGGQTVVKHIKKMMRVADRHSVAKGKGRIRGEGQALLNRLRGEAKRGE